MKTLKLFFSAFAAAFLALVVAGFFANADDAIPLGDWLSQAFQLGKNWSTLGLWGGISLAVKLMVDATKTDLFGGLFHRLPDGTQYILITALATLSVGVTVLMKGGNWPDVVASVLQSTGGAVLLNEVLKRMLGIGVKSQK